MRIGMLTWYNAVNHGALLQGYALQQVYKQLGVEPVMLQFDRSGRYARKKSILKRVGDNLSLSKYRIHIINRWFSKEKRYRFDMFISRYISLGKICTEEKGLDAVSVGSDMVFDISEGYNPFVYGKGIDTDYLFSYAASFGRSTPDSLRDFKELEEMKELMSRFRGLGCRDENTRRVLGELFGRNDTVENIDPVVLYGFDEEKRTWDSGLWSARKPYIALYGYDSSFKDENERRIITDYAKQRGLALVSVGYYHSWCDESFSSSPEEFFEALKNAELVVTDTFHGTVFSTILQKQFKVFIRNNGFKIRDYLNKLGIAEKVIANGADKLQDSEIAYEEVNKRISKLRQSSLDYIKEQIDNIKGLEK